MALNDTLDQLNLIDIYRTFHPKSAEYTFFPSAHGMFSRRGHMLGHKASSNKVKRIKIISMKLEINYRKKNGKNTNMWRQNNMLLKNQQVNEEFKEEIQKYLETKESKNTMIQNLWNTAKEVLRGWFIMI